MKRAHLTPIHICAAHVLHRVAWKCCKPAKSKEDKEFLVNDARYNRMGTGPAPTTADDDDVEEVEDDTGEESPS